MESSGKLILNSTKCSCLWHMAKLQSLYCEFACIDGSGIPVILCKDVLLSVNHQFFQIRHGFWQMVFFLFFYFLTINLFGLVTSSSNWFIVCCLVYSKVYSDIFTLTAFSYKFFWKLYFETYRHYNTHTYHSSLNFSYYLF